MFGTAQSHPSIQLAGIHVSHLAKNKNKCTQNLTTELFTTLLILHPKVFCGVSPLDKVSRNFNLQFSPPTN